MAESAQELMYISQQVAKKRETALLVWAILHHWDIYFYTIYFNIYNKEISLKNVYYLIPKLFTWSVWLLSIPSFTIKFLFFSSSFWTFSCFAAITLIKIGSILFKLFIWIFFPLPSCWPPLSWTSLIIETPTRLREKKHAATIRVDKGTRSSKSTLDFEKYLFKASKN